MRMFVLVIGVATVVGGFVGGELSDKTFSITGAVGGGVATTAVLLGLGAYFHAQEERKRKANLPPEVRAVFDRMVGQSFGVSPRANRGWTPRPFFKNQSKSDFQTWFRNVAPWSSLDPRLTNLMIDRLHANPTFEVFVHVSQDLNLVPQYASLRTLFDSGAADVGAWPRIAAILYAAGAQARSRVGQLVGAPDRHKDELTKQYSRAGAAFESALLLEPKFLPAYYELAQLDCS